MSFKGALGPLAPFSYFQVKPDGIIPHNKEDVIIVMKPQERLAFFGRVGLQVYRGKVTVFGHVLSPSPSFIPVFAPYTTFSLDIWASSPSSSPLGNDSIGKAVKQSREGKGGNGEGEVIIVLRPLHDEMPKGWFEMPNKLGDKFRPFDPFLIPGFHPLLEAPSECIIPQYEEPQTHREIMAHVPSPFSLKGSHFITLVCGAQHGGKSTYCRYLVNQLLNIHKSILFLETDVGQCEFTAPGLVSEPLMGPPFTHTRNPIKSYYLGDTSPARNPKYYIDSFKALVDHYHATYPGIPLVVNTCGWIHGLGRDLLEEQLKYAKPDLLVNMRTPIEAGKKPRKGEDAGFLTGEYLTEITNGNPPLSFDIRITNYPAGPTVLRKDKVSADIRLVQTLSYFNSHSVAVTSHVPYAVPWNKMRLVFTESSVAPSQSLRAINGTTVGLCIDNTPYPVYNPGHCQDSDLYPSFFADGTIPLCECIGAGIVRSVDPSTRQFYITVPDQIDSTLLQRVNTLIRGTIPTPTPLSLDLTDGQKKVAGAPYTAVDTSSLKLNRPEASHLALRVQESESNKATQKNKKSAPKRKSQPGTKDYGPDSPENVGQNGHSAPSLNTPKGPKAVSEIGLEEELELLSNQKSSKSPKSPKTPSTPSSKRRNEEESPKHKKNEESPKHKKQKKNKSKNIPHEEDTIPQQHTEEITILIEETTTVTEEAELQLQLSSQSHVLAELDRVDDNDEGDAHVHTQTFKQFNSKKKHKAFKMRERAAQHSKRVARRIAPADSTAIVGSRPGTHIPRK